MQVPESLVEWTYDTVLNVVERHASESGTFEYKHVLNATGHGRDEHLILISLRSLSFLDALGPPMEAGGGANEIGLRLQGDTACGLSVLEIVDRGEMPVGQDGVGERPEMLGGLQLGRVRRQEEQMHMLGDVEAGARVPARPIQEQHELFGGPRADLGSERRQLGLKERDIDGGGHMKDGAARGGMDEADEVAPVVPMLDRREGALPIEAPDFVQDRFQANAVLVDCPEFDGGLGEGGRDLAEEWTNVFLNASC